MTGSADKIIKLVRKYLDCDAVYRNTISEPIKAMLERNLDQEGIVENNTPEILELKKEWLKQHWDDWLDTSIPLLNDQTPRKASRTTKGRELLEVLLMVYEQHDSKRPGDDKDLLTPVERIRKELGI